LLDLYSNLSTLSSSFMDSEKLSSNSIRKSEKNTIWRKKDLPKSEKVKFPWLVLLINWKRAKSDLPKRKKWEKVDKIVPKPPLKTPYIHGAWNANLKLIYTGPFGAPSPYKTLKNAIETAKSGLFWPGNLQNPCLWRALPPYPQPLKTEPWTSEISIKQTQIYRKWTVKVRKWMVINKFL